MNYQFTTSDYIAAIEREQQKRETTYPKILLKMQKKGALEREVDLTKSNQFLQNQRLQVVWVGLTYGSLDSHIQVGFIELVREFKLRKRLYPRFVYFNRIAQDVADYELAVWYELCVFFAENFLGDAGYMTRKYTLKS